MHNGGLQKSKRIRRGIAAAIFHDKRQRANLD
jgi:hypothetical protein